jgi:5'-methylthioinosine phosphorylase
MTALAIIGGTGLNDLDAAAEPVGNLQTPYGPASALVQRLRLAGRELLFLARHGQPHSIAPHAINYRANLWLLAQLGVQDILAVNAVGGIARHLDAGALAVPDQLIDYSWGRASTFSDAEQLLHVDFTEPFTPRLRRALIDGADSAGLDVTDGGTYACTQGPRLETAAEINRLERDGCDLVGMTAMPEAVLARELGLGYASLCLVVNPAAGRGSGPITEDGMRAVMQAGMQQVQQVLAAAVSGL